MPRDDFGFAAPESETPKNVPTGEAGPGCPHCGEPRREASAGEASTGCLHCGEPRRGASAGEASTSCPHCGEPQRVVLNCSVSDCKAGCGGRFCVNASTGFTAKLSNNRGPDDRKLVQAMLLSERHPASLPACPPGGGTAACPPDPACCSARWPFGRGHRDCGRAPRCVPDPWRYRRPAVGPAGAKCGALDLCVVHRPCGTCGARCPNHSASGGYRRPRWRLTGV